MGTPADAVSNASSSLTVLPEYTTMLIVLFLCGVISYGVTQVVKVPCRRLIGSDLKVSAKDHVVWQFSFRILPLIIGGVTGTQFLEWPWGVAVGVTGAILNVALYRQTTSLIKTINPMNKTPKR